MSAYKDYMDRIEMDKAQQEKLMAALKAAPQTESGADDILNEDGFIKEKPKKKAVMKLVRIAALPAAAMLLIALLPGLFGSDKQKALKKEGINRTENVTSAGIAAKENEEDDHAPAKPAPESFFNVQSVSEDLPCWQTKTATVTVGDWDYSAHNTKSPTGAVPGDRQYGKIVLTGDAEKAFREILGNSAETASDGTKATTAVSDLYSESDQEYTFVYDGETYIFLHFEEGFVIRLEPKEGPVISLSREDTQKLYQLLQEAM